MRCFNLFMILIFPEVVVIVITYVYLYKQYKLACLKYDIDCQYEDGLIVEEDYLEVQRLKDFYDTHYSKKNELKLKQKMIEILDRSSNNPQV